MERVPTESLPEELRLQREELFQDVLMAQLNFLYV